MATTAAAAAMEGGIGSMSAPTIDARTSTAAADDDLESHFPFFRPPASIPLLNEATSTAGLISSQDISIATYTRSKRGVETVDPIFDDPYQLYRFFVAHNDRPSMHILITGSHVEKRSSEERMADGTTKVIHQKHKVTDFKIDFDLTPYILPTGTLMTLPDPKTGIQPTLRDVMEEHVEEENPFKELHMEKKVIWDYEHLTRTITQAIRSINYRYTIEISYPIMNNRVVVHSSSPLANLMRSNWTKALCFMSVVGMIAYPLREMYKKVKDKVLQSEFQMAISTTDFFNDKDDDEAVVLVGIGNALLPAAVRFLLAAIAEA
ncbi:hypothetical protein BCR41DRAFT_375446 [Lobosporangium transversale]|uniref:Uncharacterized protein n=1 Tax=Lobosporangium transversale TaxID=64571 RepID=A0A1Y2G773_9FUNG|nr:hypothetical protein BCR41DRAFT_375446 [Lobosporangium transversale]ORY99614.1 hypothetical protein BCR41DRAFT_375446 [Lobosporangium transversale]|eukprot:XP_021875909.1 hypothetical protein BCR41DRAFT_375446 [Lobosporangium transversale]